MTAPPPDTPNRIYRQRSPQVSGWACLVICALLLIMSAVSWASSHPSWVFVAWVCFGAAVAWAVLLRPSLELSQRGVLLRNVLRDVHIPWTQVDDVGQRWNVKVYTPDDRSYPSWAIAAQADRPRRSVLGQRLRDYDA
ncbi:MAG TPA: PH domain-containing protein, partial [Segeticoccus sp.]|nr:PH domain-containing protein [Segeticoccus sp.]